VRGTDRCTGRRCTGRGRRPVADADRAEPPPLYGYYDAFIDFSKQTFNGVPTPMDPKTFTVDSPPTVT